MSDNYLFSEIYPVIKENLPRLFAYRITISSGIEKEIGRKLCYRLGEEWGGYWTFEEGLIIGDLEKSKEECKATLDILWKKPVFNNLVEISQFTNFDITPSIMASFFSVIITKKHQYQLNKMLGEVFVSGDVQVKKECNIKRVVFQDYPCIFISIKSDLSYKYEICDFIKKNGHESLIGKSVKCKYNDHTGTIRKIIGELKDHRQRLLANCSEEGKKYLLEGNDSSLVVSLGQYDYVIDALKLTVTLSDLKTHKNYYNADSNKISKNMRLTPENRFNLIKKIATFLNAKERRYIREEPIKQLINQNIFFNQNDILEEQYIKFGNDKSHAFNSKIISHLKKFGLYKVNSIDKSIRIGLISIAEKSPKLFLEKLNEIFKSLSFKLKTVPVLINGESRNTQRIFDAKPASIEKAIKPFLDITEQVDIILTILPDSETEDTENTENTDNNDSPYKTLKRICLKNGIQSQIVSEKTVSDYNFKIDNIVLGILAKTGNIPYILSEPLDFTDFVVGIDIGRKTPRNTKGSINIAAASRVYLNNGELFQYNICEDIVEGETLPKNILQSFFPLKEFGGKRVIIHRDGLFRGNEVKDLNEWAEDINATFYLVEITKDGNPRIYSTDGQIVIFPQKGDGFYLNDKQAILVSSLPPSKMGTPQTLRITCKSDNITIQQALQSVLAMTLLHYGSLHPPKLPITIYYSDIIANLAINGIKPKNMTGNIPYWL
ncbi:MAG: hypothetical protein RIT27_1703 [Pseudomonadota bacterium]|jgi:argonaute-like protein implicated in RNA metabolism and viral defense